MASTAWLPQELRSSPPQVPDSGLPAGQCTDSSAPACSVAQASSSKDTLDSVQEPASVKFAAVPGFVPPSFSYSVPPNLNMSTGSSQQVSTNPVTKSNSSASSATPQPLVPGVSSSSSPSFSYNIAHSGISVSGGPQFQPRMPMAQSNSVAANSVSSSVASLQPPVTGQSARPSFFLPGTSPPMMPPPRSSSVPVPQGVSSNAASFSYNGDPQTVQIDQSFQRLATEHVAQGTSGASSVPSGAYSTSNTALLNSNMGPSTFMLPSTPFQVTPGGTGVPISPGAPGVPPGPLTNVTIRSMSANSSSVQLGPTPTSAIQPNPHASFPLNLHILPPHQGSWLQSPQSSALPRPPLLPYPTFPGSFPLPPHIMTLPTGTPSNPSGISPVGAPGVVAYVAPGSQSAVGAGMQLDLPPGTDKGKDLSDINIKDAAASSESVDSWSAHRTETGAMYYYNSLTRESTYQRPAGFKGEPDKATAQSTPISWEKCASTDWSLVTTNDGKRYYYNIKTKLSSWQVPSEVTELRKKQDDDATVTQSASAQNAYDSGDKGGSLLTLSTPAVTTGGRDATALRTSGVAVSSTALDLIKKKLQESGASPNPMELNGSTAVAASEKGKEIENGKDKMKDANVDGNLSDTSSDSDDVDNEPTKEECTIKFKEMLIERGVAPFSKWEKELPKIVFDPRFKAIPNHSARRALFEHYVRTRAEEERKEKRAAQKAAVEGYKQLLEDAKEDINHRTDYQTFKKKWGCDLRFEALDRKEREVLFNERVLPLKRRAEEEAQAMRAAFKSMLHDRGDINTSSRWSKVKDSLRDDPRYKSVRHEDREALFIEYLSELKSAEEEAERLAKAKRDEEEKLKERERALRKRKEREEQEVERVRSKARRKEAIETYQALLVEIIRDPQVSWTDSTLKLEKDPQGRAANPSLDQSDLEKLFREHVKTLNERCANDFKALLAEFITAEASGQEKEEGKTALTSWSTAKSLLRADPRYSKMPRKERESLWSRHVDEIKRKQKLEINQHSEKPAEARTRSGDTGKYHSGSRKNHDRK